MVCPAPVIGQQDTNCWVDAGPHSGVINRKRRIALVDEGDLVSNLPIVLVDPRLIDVDPIGRPQRSAAGPRVQCHRSDNIGAVVLGDGPNGRRPAHVGEHPGAPEPACQLMLPEVERRAGGCKSMIHCKDTELRTNIRLDNDGGLR